MIKGVVRNIPDGYGMFLKIINERHVQVYSNVPSQSALNLWLFLGHLPAASNHLITSFWYVISPTQTR